MAQVDELFSIANNPNQIERGSQIGTELATAPQLQRQSYMRLLKQEEAQNLLNSIRSCSRSRRGHTLRGSVTASRSSCSWRNGASPGRSQR